MVKQHLDWRPIHIIKFNVVHVGGRHLWVSFLYTKKHVKLGYHHPNANFVRLGIIGFIVIKFKTVLIYQVIVK